MLRTLALVLLLPAVGWADTATRLVCKDFNPSMLDEELSVLTFSSVRQPFLRGFDYVTTRQLTPSPGPKLVGTSSSGGVTTEDWAESCELRFDFPGTPSAGDLTTLDAILAAHDYTVLTTEQERQDQDELDVAEILAYQAAYKQHLQNWDGYTLGERSAATKEMFTILGKVMRIMLRRMEGAEI